MDFTREPLIETVITPKDGCKLVVRSSKTTGQEEYFVDAVEVISFGHALFFRSTERPKTFLVPASDYEVVEVREARMVLKNVGLDRTIKIGGGREGQMRSNKEPVEKATEPDAADEKTADGAENGASQASTEKSADARLDKKRDRRRQNRRRRGREGNGPEEEGAKSLPIEGAAKEGSRSGMEGQENMAPLIPPGSVPSILTSLLPPPPTLISETIARYRDNAMFKDAFYSKGEQSSQPSQGEVLPNIALEQPLYGSFEVSEEEEEQIYQHRKKQSQEEPFYRYEEPTLRSDADLEAPHPLSNEKEDI